MQKSISIKNHKLSYTTHSEGKEKIILIHGWSSFQFFWSHILEYIKPLGECTTLDLMGHYPAVVPESFASFTVDELIDIQAEAIESISPDEKVTLIGHSLGGMVVLGIAGKYPHLVKKIISICPFASGPVDGFLYPIKLGFEFNLGGLISGLQKLILMSENSMQMFFYLAIHNKKEFFEKKENQEFLKQYHIEYQKLDSKIMGQYLLTVDKADIRHLLENILVPTQIHVGMHDQIVPKENGFEIIELIPNSELITFENSGHTPSLEEKEKFLDTILPFLTKQE